MGSLLLLLMRLPPVKAAVCHQSSQRPYTLHARVGDSFGAAIACMEKGELAKQICDRYPD
jgi:hypothetical protein